MPITIHHLFGFLPAGQAIQALEERIMGQLDEFKAKVVAANEKIAAEAIEVKNALDELSAQVTTLTDKVAALEIPQADKDELNTALDQLGTGIEGIYNRPAPPPIDVPPTDTGTNP